MQKVLLVDRDPRSRLIWLDSLREIVEVLVVEADELPVRRVRSARPSAVIFAIGRNRIRQTLGWSRVIKTDSAVPPAVGIYDSNGRIRDVAKAMQNSMADSMMRGVSSADERRTFLECLLSGTAEPVYEYPMTGWRQKVLGNFR